MERGRLRTGKQKRPKTTVRGKRYRCASCHVRSPKPVKEPAPWYCPKCSGVGLATPPVEPEPPPRDEDL